METRGPHVFSARIFAGPAHFAGEWRWLVRSPGQGLRRRGVGRENLIAALDAIGAPLFIVGTDGEVLHTNSNGRSLFDRDRRGLERSFARTVAGETDADGWELIPLSAGNGSRRFLAILSAVPRTVPPVVCVQSACARWKLTARQAEVLTLVARGLTNATIAESLGISIGTVEFHVAKIFDKAGVENRATLIACMHDL